MKKLFSYCFDKWWLIPLFSASLIGLAFIFDSLWFIIIGLLVLPVAVMYQFAKKGWKIGCLTGIAMLSIIALAAFWFFLQLFPSPDRIHRKFSKRYENRIEMQRILGVEVPKFSIVSSEIQHLNGFDSEIKVKCILEFKSLPDDKFYKKLDRICSLPIPKAPNKNSSLFYYGLENIDRCWSKDGNRYVYDRNTDFGDKFLHSQDAYFNFEMERGSKTAVLTYGNY